MGKAKLPSYNYRQYYYAADAADVFGMSASEYEDFARDYGRLTSYNGADYYDFSGDPSIQRWLQYRKTLVEKARAAGLSGARLQSVLAQTMYQRTDLEGADAETFYNDRENHGYQALAEALDASYQDEYNSPVNQVARDRAAGINDSLTGDIAGDTPAADAAPSESLPSPGLDPAQRKAMELQTAQFATDSILSAFGASLNFFQMFASYKDLVSNLSLREVQKNVLQGQAEGQNLANAGQRIVNRDALRRSLLDTFVKIAPSPGAGKKFNPSEVMNSFPRVNYTPEELQELDTLTNSGFFFSPDGTPSMAVQKAYAGDSAGIAQALENYAASSAKTGRFSTIEEAADFYEGEYAQFERLQIQAQSAQEIYRERILDLQEQIEAYNLSIADATNRRAQAEADSGVALSEYNQQLYNETTGKREAALKDTLRLAQEARARLQRTTDDFDKFVFDHYQQTYEDYQNDRISWAQLKLRNLHTRRALSGYKSFRENSRGNAASDAIIDMAVSMIPGGAAAKVATPLVRAGLSELND